MPIFEYRCGDCGATSEFLVGVAKESDDIECSSCGGTRMTKMFSPVNSVSYTHLRAHET